jgi:hypothetical protein
MAVTSTTAKRFVRQLFLKSRKSRLSYSVNDASRGRPVDLDHFENDDFETVGQLHAIDGSDFLFSAPDFPVSLGCGLVDFVTIWFLACEMP